MAKSGSDTAAEIGATGEQSPPGASPPRRINVAVTPDMLAAIERVVDREQVSLTEAVRRLIGYGDVLYLAIREEGNRVVFRSDNGDEREVLIV
jgi:hypothetical protein